MTTFCIIDSLKPQTLERARHPEIRCPASAINEFRVADHIFCPCPPSSEAFPLTRMESGYLQSLDLYILSAREKKWFDDCSHRHRRTRHRGQTLYSFSQTIWAGENWAAMVAGLSSALQRLESMVLLRKDYDYRISMSRATVSQRGRLL